MEKIRITKKRYKRKDGTIVRGTSYLTSDKGAPGRTPKEKKWFSPKGNLHGWNKNLSQQERIRRASTGRSDLSSGRSLQALSNVSTDRKTKTLAKKDAAVFFKRLKK